VVPFSSVRFVRSSMQRTAARRKLQRWLLLACRALLLLLLVWAIAQPAHHVASNWLGGAKSPIAAIVVDTSYSMQLRDQETALLDRADAAVQSLLREQMAGARVALFRSVAPPAGQPEVLLDAGDWLARWSPLQPTPADQPLAERVTAATAFLNDQSADQKWLFVLSDFQSREFPRPIKPPTDVRAVCLDLHAADARSAGISQIALHPERPLPGVGSEAVVSLAGRAGESRAVTLRVADVAGKVFSESTLVAALDRAGRSQLRFPLKLPAERWLLLTASLPAGDGSPWDDSRTQLVEMPPRRTVAVLSPTPAPPAERFLRLALDPAEGADKSWPLLISSGGQITPDTSVAVALLMTWPTPHRATELAQFARGGGTVIIAMQPGLEASWDALPAEQRAAIAELIGSTPVNRPISGEFSLLPGNAGSPLMEGLTDPTMQLSSAIVRRFVPLDVASATTETLLAASRSTGSGTERPAPLLTRSPLGAGVVFTLATLPDPRFTNLPTHPIFLPTLVRAALSGSGGSTPTNVEIGQPIVLRDRSLQSHAELTMTNPRDEAFVVPGQPDGAGRSFTFEQAIHPGLHKFAAVGKAEPLVLANVQLPGVEVEPDRREAADVASGENVVVVRSVEELQSRFAALSEPEPKWSAPIAMVLALLCFESLMGSVTTAWRWPFGHRAAMNDGV
jgi:hypothetical protein